MASILKGFVEILDFVNNNPNETSPLGEISTFSMTFTKDRKEYFNTAIPNYRLVGISNYDSITGDQITINEDLYTLCMNVVNTLRTYSLNKVPPLDNNDLIATIYADYYNIVTNFQFQDMISYNNVTIPGYITFTAYDTDVFLWTSDSAFKNQYPDYSITVIPPLPNINDFTKTGSQVRTELAELSPSDQMVAVQTAKVNNPETVVRGLTIDYVDPVNRSLKTPVTWYFLIYGLNGDDIDVIKDAAIDYLHNNSTQPDSFWELIFPDLFTRTQFIITPNWNKKAIPDLTVTAGIYSSVIQVNNDIELVPPLIPMYDPDYVKKNTYFTTHPYRNLGLFITNGTNNKTGYTDWLQLFPDYLPLDTTSLDFNRMSQYTINFLLMLEKLLIASETSTKYNITNYIFRMRNISNVTYLSMIYDNVKYMVSIKNQ